jgi:hypothetical protein
LPIDQGFDSVSEPILLIGPQIVQQLVVVEIRPNVGQHFLRIVCNRAGLPKSSRPIFDRALFSRLAFT